MQNTTVTSLSFSQYFLVQVGDLGKDDVFSCRPLTVRD